MTEERGALIEAMARAVADEMRSNHVFVSDDLNNCLVDGGLFDLHNVAQAALTAISNAGYAIVPVEPTEAILDAGAAHSLFAADHNALANASDMYRAMLSASPIITKGTDE